MVRGVSIHDRKMTNVKCISVSAEFDQLARENSISWSEAARVGMSMMLADIGVVEYDNQLNLKRKMDKFREIAEMANQKLAEIESGVKK
jgi:hypothetical protein